MAAAIQTKLYAAGILTVKQFAAVVDDKTELRQVMKDSFGLDSGANLDTRVSVSKVLVAWTSARARALKMADAEGEAESRNLPKDISSGDYHSMRTVFEERFWELTDRELPGRSYIEKKLDEIEKIDLKPELLSDVVSREEDEPDSMKTVWGPGGELRALKISAKVPLPSDTESFRHRIILLGTAWLFISFHQTNRSSLLGLSPQLFQQYLQYLLGEYVHGLLLRDGRGYEISSPAWHLLISYEFAIRARATNPMRKGVPFRDALRQGWECPMTKERYFSTPLAMDTVYRRPLPQHQPRLQPQEPVAKRAKIEDEEGKGKGKRAKKASKLSKSEAHAKKASSYNGALQNADGKPMCFKFNTTGCKNSKCVYQHACGGCFKQNVSMKDCVKCKGNH